jgi:cytidylate kinase
MMDNPKLKSDTAGQMASRVAPHPPLRQAILDLQRTLAHTPPEDLKGAVLDGRDCGTVICPAAQHKFFITASTETRSKRRYAELQSMGEKTSYDEVFADMKERDDRDANRAEAPMKPAENAIVIDTSMLTANQAFELVVENL